MRSKTSDRISATRREIDATDTVPYPSAGEEREPRRYAWVAVICVVAVLVGVYLWGRSHRRVGPETEAAQAADEGAVMNASPPKIETDHVAKPSAIAGRLQERKRRGARASKGVESGIPREAIVGAGVPATGKASEKGTDLWDRLAQWGFSMTSPDPAAQTAFYADHVDRYFLRTNVSREFVLRDKEAFLRSGNRVRRFTLQDVEVEDQTDSTARLRLVKHYVLENPSNGRSERYVKSELSLKKIDGRWVITGERDFK